jgi:hypothetical protein
VHRSENRSFILWKESGLSAMIAKCRGEYLELGKMEKHGTGENCIIRVFVEGYRFLEYYSV